MKVQIIFKEKSLQLLQDYTNKYNGVKEDDTVNDELFKNFEMIEDVDEFYFSEDCSHQLFGGLENGIQMDLNLPDMASVVCIKEEKVHSQYSVSKKLLQETYKVHDKEDNTSKFYFYLKPDMKYTFLDNRICILLDEIPQDLM